MQRFAVASNLLSILQLSVERAYDTQRDAKSLNDHRFQLPEQFADVSTILFHFINFVGEKDILILGRKSSYRVYHYLL